VYDDDDLPSLHSGDDEEDSDWSSSVGPNSEASGDDIFSSDPVAKPYNMPNFEMPYEILPRRHDSKREVFERKMKALPIKLADGKIKDTGLKVVTNVSTEEELSSDESEVIDEVEPVEDISTGARFGRLAVVDILQTKSRKQKIELAKEQIAGICQDILADPENSVSPYFTQNTCFFLMLAIKLGLLRRLHTFTLTNVTTLTDCNPVPNDPVIRQLAILSQMTVFKDIIPGYRIRALTESEKTEKVSQMVARTRDWEQGLVHAYQTYMRLLEGELKGLIFNLERRLHLIIILQRRPSWQTLHCIACANYLSKLRTSISVPIL
jgi:nucleolar complex protein 3